MAQSTPSHEQVALFDTSIAESQKAWTSTSMLARTRQSKASAVATVYCQGGAHEVASLLVDMAGPSFASASMKTGLDAQRAAKLAEAVLEIAFAGVLEDRQAARRILSGVDTAAEDTAVMAAERHMQIVRAWVERGEHEKAPDLKRINALVGDSPAMRLAIVSSVTPAMALSGLVVRAVRQQFPFRPDAAKPQPELHPEDGRPAAEHRESAS